MWSDEPSTGTDAGESGGRIDAHKNQSGGILMPGMPAEFGAFIRAETAKWAKVVEFSGAKAE